MDSVSRNNRLENPFSEPSPTSDSELHYRAGAGSLDPHVNTPPIGHSVALTPQNGYSLNDSSVLSNSSPVVPSLFGFPLKYVSLVTLAVQNASLTIIMHYSRISTPPDRTYSAASAVLLNEILKGSISFMIAFTRTPAARRHYSPIPPSVEPTSTSPSHRLHSLQSEIFSSDCWKLSIPAILYVIQNNLQYVAASNLDVATFQVTYQMKILTTAAFSVLLLRKRLTAWKWGALLLLAIGVGIVQIQAGQNKREEPLEKREIPYQHQMYPLQGFLAVTAACFTSGLAGVYFEKVLKGSQVDLWVRNVQLSMFSLIPALAPAILEITMGENVGGLFRNFGFWAWATVLTQVFGGLITAVVIKYSDNILKGFATSLSIIIAFLASVILFNFHITLTFVLGAVTVLAATWMYNQPDSKDETISVARTVHGPYGSPMRPEEPLLGYPQDPNGHKKQSSLGGLSDFIGRGGEKLMRGASLGRTLFGEEEEENMPLAGNSRDGSAESPIELQSVKESYPR